MKKFTNLLLVISACFFYACRESESVAPRQPLPNTPKVPVVPAAPAVAAFQNTTVEVKENDGNQQTIIIALSKPAPADGTLVIKLSSTTTAYGIDFETSPAAVNGEINLIVAKGDLSVRFDIKPIQNTIVNNERKAEFAMARATGGVTTAANAALVLEIKDDDLGLRLKKYETVSGAWRASREFQYNDKGEVNSITWTTHTPFATSGSYTYYRENGKVVRMTDQIGFVTNYIWKDGRVIKSERIEREQLKQRIEYAYDDAGNVGEMVYYNRQPDGTLQRSMVMLFLYDLDGNIYKKLTYYVEEGKEPELASTQTFEDYLAQPNPLPMVETLPHLNAQPNLPRTYQLEIGGQILHYEIQYQLRADGLPTQRTLRGGANTETTAYTYQ
ncbi:MAG: hypothetical protein ACKODM_10505 [Cytophagales bacterium]